jgi:hypothetical protein
MFLATLWKIRKLSLHRLISGSSVLFHCSMCLFLYQYCGSLVLLEVRNCDPSSFALFKSS